MFKTKHGRNECLKYSFVHLHSTHYKIVHLTSIIFDISTFTKRRDFISEKIYNRSYSIVTSGRELFCLNLHPTKTHSISVVNKCNYEGLL